MADPPLYQEYEVLKRLKLRPSELEAVLNVASLRRLPAGGARRCIARRRSRLSRPTIINCEWAARSGGTSMCAGQASFLRMPSGRRQTFPSTLSRTRSSKPGPVGSVGSRRPARRDRIPIPTAWRATAHAWSTRQPKPSSESTVLGPPEEQKTIGRQRSPP